MATEFSKFPKTTPQLISPVDVVHAAISQLLSLLRDFPRDLELKELCRRIESDLRLAENDAEAHFLDGDSEAHRLFDGRISKNQEFLGIVAPSLHQAIWQYVSILVSMAENVLARSTRSVPRREFLARLQDHFCRLPGPFEGSMEYGQWDRWFIALESERAAALRGDPRVDDRERTWEQLKVIERQVIGSYGGRVGLVMTGPQIAIHLRINYETASKLKRALREMAKEGRFLAKVGPRGGYRLVRLPRQTIESP